MKNRQQHNRNRQDRKTHHFFTIGLFGHILSILFVGLYGILDESTADLTHFHVESIGFTLERDFIVHGITILTLVLLYVSFALKLTWPLRIEEMLVIIVLWAWLGNVFGAGTTAMCDSPFWWYTATSTTTTGTAATAVTQQPPNDTVVVIASDVVNANLHHLHTPPHAHPIFSHLPCGWSLFGAYFSFVCVGSSLLSFVANTRNYCLAFLFKTLTVMTTVVLFVVPLACNRFRLMSTPVLILKLTLYSLAWNMNRFMIDTQNDIVGNYNKAGRIMRMTRYDTQSMALRPRASHYEEDSGDDSASENETTMNSDDEDYGGDDDDDDDYTAGYRSRRLTPIKVFRGLDKTNKEARRLTPTNRRLTAEQKIQVQQLSYFSGLYKTSREYRPSCFWSWRYRGYDDAVSDLTRTVWILAICPLYLFVVVIFLFILAYYIRRNQLELHATEKTLVSMEELR